MGNSGSNVSTMTPEMLEEYSQLTYLNKAEIVYIFRSFETLGPKELQENLHCRFPIERILQIIPQLRNNPFRESIFRVFSSKSDDCMSFEDVLDLYSAFSENCPVDVRAAWAFRIFDLDSDNQVSLDDLIEAVERITGIDEKGRIRIDRPSAERVAQTVLQEMDMDHTGSIGAQEFVHTVSRIPEFSSTFRLMP
ncbi:calcium and integrin-binding protein 1-like [Venturia canescens]|uniref:calcium and integrin-binding protein 1-like n=1 Tax=Venturia canescens TaxID=32260 RepID=UPI001C9C47D4|nr:calcium and integrin-binding protein 1-like [Venturia canescens]